MSHEVNKRCITQHVVAKATCLRSFEIHETQLDVAGKSSAFFLLNQPLHASCGSPGDLHLVATFSELSLGCSDCCV